MMAWIRVHFVYERFCIGFWFTGKLHATENVYGQNRADMQPHYIQNFKEKQRMELEMISLDDEPFCMDGMVPLGSEESLCGFTGCFPITVYQTQAINPGGLIPFIRSIVILCR